MFHSLGAPTNIYIQGLDSVSRLSNEVRVLKEENQGLQSRLQQTSRGAAVTALQQTRNETHPRKGRYLILSRLNANYRIAT